MLMEVSIWRQESSLIPATRLPIFMTTMKPYARDRFLKERKIDDLVIAKGPDDEEYAIFYAKDALPADHAKAQPYDVKEHL